MAKLVGRLEQNAPRRPPDFETPLGVELASIFDSLAISSDQEPRSCSAPLRDLTRDLTELFGPAIGQIAVTTNVDRLTLPAFRHRALILMANELVTNALLHAFKDRRFGRITLQLSVLARGSARLTVMDDGESARHQPSPCSVINYLADLLESDLVYQTRFGGGLIAEIEIPL
jgi:two-component sensor histidine kinase